MIFAPKPEKLLDQQMEEAKRRHLEHSVAAEHHQGIADAAAKTVARLQQLKEATQ